MSEYTVSLASFYNPYQPSMIAPFRVFVMVSRNVFRRQWRSLQWHFRGPLPWVNAPTKRSASYGYVIKSTEQLWGWNHQSMLLQSGLIDGQNNLWAYIWSKWSWAFQNDFTCKSQRQTFASKFHFTAMVKAGGSKTGNNYKEKNNRACATYLMRMTDWHTLARL